MSDQVETMSNMDGDQDLEINASSGGVTFDDMDYVEKVQTEDAAAKAERSKKIQQQPTDTSKDLKVEKSKEIKSREKAPDKNKEVRPIEGDNGESIEQEIKKLKAKFGDEDIEVPAESQFIAKVKGQEVPVSIQELLTEFSGKTQWDRKFTELHKERQQVQGFQEKYTNFIEKAQSENPMEALDFLLDAGQIDPHTFYSKLKEFVIPDSEEYFHLSEEERKSHDLGRENEFLKKQNESYLNNRKLEDRTKQLGQKITSLRETHQLSETEFKTAYDQLVSAGNADITPEKIASYAVSFKNAHRVEGLIKQLDPMLVQNDKVFNAVCDIVDRDPSITDDELTQLVSGITGVNTDKSKVEKKRAQQTKQAPTKREPEANSDMFESWDDFDVR